MATPTAAVVFALFASVAIVQLRIDQREVQQVYGMQSHHLLVCDALGLDDSWYAAFAVNKNGKCIHTP
jgi:hypothetical protein